MPTINVRDLAIQERENDLVVATFGRGFRVLDDVTPLRLATPETLAREATLFPVRDAWAYIPKVPYGLKGKAFLGESFYTAANPPFGAVFTTYLKDDLKGRKKARQEAEKEKAKKGEDVSLPDLGRAPRRGSRGGAGAPPDRVRRGRERRPAADGPAEGGLRTRRVGPPLSRRRTRRS